jgi:hypothetical protein
MNMDKDKETISKAFLKWESFGVTRIIKVLSKTRDEMMIGSGPFRKNICLFPEKKSKKRPNTIEWLTLREDTKNNQYFVCDIDWNMKTESVSVCMLEDDRKCARSLIYVFDVDDIRNGSVTRSRYSFGKINAWKQMNMMDVDKKEKYPIYSRVRCEYVGSSRTSALDISKNSIDEFDACGRYLWSLNRKSTNEIDFKPRVFTYLSNPRISVSNANALLSSLNCLLVSDWITNQLTVWKNGEMQAYFPRMKHSINDVYVSDDGYVYVAYSMFGEENTIVPMVGQIDPRKSWTEECYIYYASKGRKGSQFLDASGLFVNDSNDGKRNVVVVDAINQKARLLLKPDECPNA